MFAVLAPGALIGDRFIIEHAAGRGGMGAVYRARDTRTGQGVALKLLHAAPAVGDAARRFAREAALLAELGHPGIVSYVDHGIAEDDRPYLAMEWLEGEDLAQRLARRGMSLAESLTLIRKTALALAAAHERGIVHRDIKPSNLFLRGGRVDDVALLDFGVARHAVQSQVMTGTGTIVGTPDYMAPEQANGHGEITPSADVFALGCVLYECLTGKPPFAAPHVAAVLAKILVAEPAKVHEERPALPSELSTLLERMLAKDPSQRLPDAAALVAELSALDSIADAEAPVPVKTPPPAGLAFEEQQLVSVVLASSPGALVDGAKLETLREALSRYGAALERLVDGSLVATLMPRRGVATDQAVLAVRCALFIKERLPEATVALATGRGVMRKRLLPAGEAMDRAGQILQDHGRTRPTTGTQIVLDEVTAGLLGARFSMSQAGERAFVLEGEQLSVDESRLLLGKPTPCVGRDYELTTLALALQACVDEGSACAVLVTAPAGAGKSRLRHEFLRRVAKRDDEVLVLLGRGDPMGAGSSHGLLGQAVRGLCGVLDGEDVEVRRDKLRRRIGERLPPEEAPHVVEFVGELCGVPFPDEGSVRLRAARGDPRLMSTQISQAIEVFFKAECEQQPVLLVLEDLHWGDFLTVKLVGELLRALAQRPWMVLALARPEVKERFPHLWQDGMQEIPLRALSKKASEQLVKQVLGSTASESIVARVVEHAAGNALYLEELIRAAAEGKGDALPETVAAMLQARILRLPSSARQMLLAASIYGQTFWDGGVKALLSGTETRDGLDRWLEHLIEIEVIERRRASRFPTETEYGFRHALARDAAYGLLPDSHRPLGHKLAGAYLEEIGERNLLVLAEHHHRGGALERAVVFYVRAAEQLFEQHDMRGTLRCVQAGITCGASGSALTDLRAIQASVAFWMNDLPRAFEAGMPILPELSPGSRRWCKLIGALLVASAGLGRQKAVAELGRAVMGATPDDDARAAYVETLHFLSRMGCILGQRDQARIFLDRIDVVSAPVLAEDAVVRGWACSAHSSYHYFFGHGLWQARRWGEDGTEAFRSIADPRNQVWPEMIAGLACAALGDEDAAVAMCREGVAIAERVGQPFLISYARMFMVLGLLGSDNAALCDEATAMARAYVDANNLSALMFLGIAYVVLAKAAMRRGDSAEAVTCAQKASELLTIYRPFHLFALATLSTVLLTLGRVAEARETAALGVQIAEEIGGAAEVPVRLALAEACLADHDAPQADAALRACLAALRAHEQDIPEGPARERFLRDVPVNARAIELGRLRFGAS